MNSGTQDVEYENPVMYSEAGSMPIWGCDDQEVEIQREIYKAVFSGLAGYLEWELQRKSYYFDFRPIAEFLRNIDLEERSFHSGYTELDNNDEWIVKEKYVNDGLSNRKSVDLTYLRSKDKNSAIGVITNRTFNYNSMGGCYGFIPDPEDQEHLTTYTYTFNNPDQVPSLIGSPYSFESISEDNSNRIKLRNMKFGNYDITYYKYNSVKNIIKLSSGMGPKVKLDYPELNEDNWIVLFKAEKRNQKKSVNGKTSGSNTEVERRNVNELIIQPNPTNKVVTLTSHYRMKSIEVLDATGRTILEQKVNKTSCTVNLNKFSSGIYYFKILLKTGNVEIRKVVKK